MSITKSISLGIISCPGAEHFCNEMIVRLKKHYTKKYTQKAHYIAKRYNMQVEDVIRMINLTEDLHASKQTRNKSINRYRPPGFKVPVHFFRFANGEFKAEIMYSVKGMDLFIIQDVENHYDIQFSNDTDKHRLSVNDHIMLLFVTIDAVLEAGAESVALVLPAYPYSRQHKKRAREGLTAALFGQFCEFMGVERIITLDVHSKEIENTFNRLILENLHASYQILLKLKTVIDFDDPDLVIVAPDTGAVDRNKFYADNLKKPLGMLYKERDYSKTSKDAVDTNIFSSRLLGDVKGKIVIMADDMLGTGGTLLKAMRVLKEMGAKSIICAVSLPLFSGNAIELFDQAYGDGVFTYIIGTNSIYHNENLLNKEWYISAGVADLFARIISRIHHGRSLSPLLDNREIIQKFLQQKTKP